MRIGGLMTADQIIQLLNLKPHPEAGHYGETFRDAAGAGGRAASTAIYFLLMRGERSHWHRVDAAEVWHYYAGAPLKLEIAETDEGPIRRLRLGIVRVNPATQRNRIFIAVFRHAYVC